MGRYNFAPQRVYQAATRLLETKRITVPPPWYEVVHNLPPSERLVRPALQGARSKGKKASRLFQPVKLEYAEDELRSEFFGDHPWELARPRQVLEDDGKDYQKYDWSRLEQPGKQIDGESAVQRQAWLMGLIRHDMDFVCSPQALAYLRSPAFQTAVRDLVKSEYNIDLQCAVPADVKNPDAATALTLRLTYHPQQPHDFNAAKKHITSLLAQAGLDTATINRRSFNLAFPASPALTEQLASADFSPLLRQYQISASLGNPITTNTFGGEPQTFQTITLSYHRNFSHSLAAAVSSIATSLSLDLATLLHKPFPTTDPDTYSAYSRAQAYDLARKEFYAARHRQDIERRVAREEACFTGAEFGPSALDVGNALEDQKYEEWRAWAGKLIQTQKQLASAAYAGNTVDESEALPAEEDPAIEEALDELEPAVPAVKKP